MNRRDYILLSLVLGLLLTCFSACSRDFDDSPEEDYAKLFPWQGIEKPEKDAGEPKASICNPETELTEYLYPNEDKYKVERSYEVKLVCQFVEKDYRGVILPKNSPIKSRLLIRYIDPKTGQYIHIGTKKNDTSLDFVLTNNEAYELTFTAKSGYPLFISLSGLAEMGTTAKVSIEAKSNDGLFVIEPLQSEQTQNLRGISPLSNPYCEYVVLP